MRIVPILVLGVVLGLLPGRLLAQAETDTVPHATVKVKLAGHEARVVVERHEGDTMLFVLTSHDGRRLVMTPEEFARRVYEEQSRLSWWHRFFNISSATGFAWVALGLLGQLLFTARMLIQWLVSERERRSVVPPVFWWLSLVGATMLIVYFVWRQDIVGVLGQATGWVIYVRNLWLIRLDGAGAVAAPSSTPAAGHAPHPAGS